MHPVNVRTGLHPGDVGAIVALHGRLYAAEHGLDRRFEASVAGTLARLVLAGFPQPREQLWAVEQGGAVHGSLALTDEGDGLGRVRFFVLEPSARGAGVGRRLLGALLTHAREHGYARLELETFSDLRAAAHLYRSAGFSVVSSERHDHWGPAIDMQRYALAL